MIDIAIKNIELRFDVILNNVYELKSDIISYGALGYLIDNEIYLIAPAKSKFSIEFPKGKAIGELVEINGNYQSKEYSIIKKLNLPAFVICEDSVYFNANPFTNFQKWLQFENNITPYLNWYDRMFWLDEYSSNLLQLIVKYCQNCVENFVNKKDKENIIVFRHDVDCSTNLSYLKEANKNDIPATYAILLDKNRNFWLENLKKYDNIEVAFHYESNSVSLIDYFKMAINKFLNKNYKIENSPNDWNKRSLLKQINKAISNNINVSTIHRHFAFINYPEIINEFEKIKKAKPNILGGGSFSRANVLKYNLKCTNIVENGFYHFENDVGSPFWYPFKLYNPITKNEVNFWEQAYIQEPSSELIKKMLQKKIYGINKNVFTISLHPSHSETTTFRKDGQISTFREIIKLRDEFNIKFKTLKSVYEELNNEYR